MSILFLLAATQPVGNTLLDRLFTFTDGFETTSTWSTCVIDAFAVSLTVMSLFDQVAEPVCNYPMMTDAMLLESARYENGYERYLNWLSVAEAEQMAALTVIVRGAEEFKQDRAGLPRSYERMARSCNENLQDIRSRKVKQ